MLLINLFKRASVNSSVFKSSKYLMLFLLSKCSIFLSFLFYNSIHAQKTIHFNEPIQVNEIHINVKHFSDNSYTNKKHFQNYVSREEKAEESLILQIRNFRCIGILSIAIVTLLLGYIVFHQYKFKRLNFDRDKELQEALSIIESQNIQFKEKQTIFNNCCNTIRYRLSTIITSIDEVIYQFEIKDKKLINKLTSVNEIAINALSDLTDNYQCRYE